MKRRGMVRSLLSCFVMSLVVIACGEDEPDEGPTLRFVQAVHGAPEETVDVYVRASGALTWPTLPIVSGLGHTDTARLDLAEIEQPTSSDAADETEDIALDVVVLRSGEHPDTTLYTAASFGLPWPSDDTTRLLVAHRPNVAGTPPLLHASAPLVHGEARAGIVAFDGCQWLDAPIELHADDDRVLATALPWQGFTIETSVTSSAHTITWIEARDDTGQVVRFVPSRPLHTDDLTLVLVDDLVQESCLLVVSDWANDHHERLAPAP